MKPFNLEAALAGAPVVTRAGVTVTQLTRFSINSGPALRGVVDGVLISWYDDGGLCLGKKPVTALDLFMASTIKTGWVNVYPNGPCYMYDTEDEANEAAYSERAACVKVEWEE